MKTGGLKMKFLLAGTIRLDQPRKLSGLIFFRTGFVVRRLRIHHGYARGSLLALRQNLRRSRILPNRIGPVKKKIGISPAIG